jgi:putative hemolysin
MAGEILVLLALILLNGFFSLSEMAVVSSRKARLRHEAEQGRKNYRLALETAERPSRFLSTIQVVITLIGILTGAFGGVTIARGLEKALAGLPLIGPYATPISVGLVVILTTFVSVVLGELVPKSLALSRPEPIAAAVIGPVRALAVVFSPLSRLLSATTDLVVSLFGGKKRSEPDVTEEEIRVLIALGAESGVFEQGEREMVEGVLSLDDRRVTALMTPRTEVVTVDLGDGPEKARGVILEHSSLGFIPAVEDDLDNVVGMLPVKDCLAAIATGSFRNASDFLVPPVLVPESVSPLRVLAALRQGRTKSALIVDEYGGVSGLISLTDLIGTIVGEISGSDGEHEPAMTRREDGSWLVDGSLALDSFAEALGLDETPGDGEYDTVAGLVLDRMGSIPRTGDRCAWEGYEFEVVDMDGNRIDKLLVSAKPAPEPEEPAID